MSHIVMLLKVKMIDDILMSTNPNLVFIRTPRYQLRLDVLIFVYRFTAYDVLIAVHRKKVKLTIMDEILK